jgi:hypothetical protein
VGIVSNLSLSEPSISAVEALWQRQATAAAIKAARDIVKFDGVIPPGTQVGRLSDTEWGWIAVAIIFAWISARAEQATAEGRDIEFAVRLPEPWDAGVVAAILPDLFETLEEGDDWTRPMQNWSREQMIEFMLRAFYLTRNAMTARDVGGGTVTRKHKTRFRSE